MSGGDRGRWRSQSEADGFSTETGAGHAEGLGRRVDRPVGVEGGFDGRLVEDDAGGSAGRDSETPEPVVQAWAGHLCRRGERVDRFAGVVAADQLVVAKPLFRVG